MASVPYPGMVPVAYHLCVDGSFYRRQAQAGWVFVVVVEDTMGSFCLLGFAADHLLEQHACPFGANVVDHIFAEAVNTSHAVSWFLTQPPLLAFIYFDCTLVGGAVLGISSSGLPIEVGKKAPNVEEA